MECETKPTPYLVNLANQLSQTRVCVCVLSCFSRVRLFAAPRTIIHQASLSMGFSRQEYWSRLPFPPPGYLPYPWMEPTSFTSPALAGGLFITSATRGALQTLDESPKGKSAILLSLQCQQRKPAKKNPKFKFLL